MSKMAGTAAIPIARSSDLGYHETAGEGERWSVFRPEVLSEIKT
jgi:hypothetical protein